MADRPRPAGPIAAYLADRAAIDAKLAEHRERCKQAEIRADETGAEPEYPRDYSDRRARADYEANERRHFGPRDPRNGLSLDTPARLWRWLTYTADDAEARWVVASATPHPLVHIDPGRCRNALAEAYAALHRLGHPAAPDPTRGYPLLTEGEARDALRAIANRLRAEELESPAPAVPETVPPPEAPAPAAPPSDTRGEPIPLPGKEPETDRPMPAGPPVLLRAAPLGPIVRGKGKPRLTEGQRRVVEVLLSAYPKRLSKDELATRSKTDDPVKMLDRLRRDEDWAAVLDKPGQAHGGYGIICPPPGNAEKRRETPGNAPTNA